MNGMHILCIKYIFFLTFYGYEINTLNVFLTYYIVWYTDYQLQTFRNTLYGPGTEDT